MAHWHDYNPWANTVVYLPDIDELSACLDPLNPTKHKDRWLERGNKLDAYLLPQPSGYHDIGIRYGKEGSEYYSPYCHPAMARLLLLKYGPKDPTGGR